MIGVGRGYDSNPRMQPMKGSVVFICLNHCYIALRREYKVAFVVFKYPSHKGTAIYLRLAENVCYHSTYSSFAMRSSTANGIAKFCNIAQYLRALHHGEALLLKINKLGVSCWHSRRVNYQCGVRIQKLWRNALHIVLVMNDGSLFL